MSDDERANIEQAASEHRVTHASLFDEEVRPHNERFRAAAAIRPGERVLDVGCGAGESTRDAARASVHGSVLGVDLSAELLDVARRLTDDDGLRNATYQQADAQIHRFPAELYDSCISRFGTMFFADPVAAFANIRTALRPAGRLVLLVWQQHDRNEWSTAIRQALGATAVPPGRQHMFSLSDPAVAEGILAAAGFAEVSFTDVHEPVYYGPDVATAADFVLGLREPKELLATLDASTAEHALERLRSTLAAHDSGSGVYFDSRTWIITARRSG